MKSDASEAAFVVACSSNVRKNAAAWFWWSCQLGMAATVPQGNS